MMTKSNFFIWFMVSTLAISCGDDKPRPMDGVMLTEPEVKAFIEAYDKAWMGRDTAGMKSMMHEKYIYFNSTGSTSDRSNIIGWFSPAAKYKVDSSYRNEINIILNGNTAIVNTHWVGSGIFGEETFDDDQRCGLVIQKLNDSIKIISEHCVQIKKKGF